MMPTPLTEVRAALYRLAQTLTDSYHMGGALAAEDIVEQLNTHSAIAVETRMLSLLQSVIDPSPCVTGLSDRCQNPKHTTTDYLGGPCPHRMGAELLRATGRIK